MTSEPPGHVAPRTISNRSSSGTGAPSGATPSATPPSPDGATRGLTRIAPNVVERVAAYACRDVNGVLVRPALSEDTKVPSIRARADVMGAAAHVTVWLPVEYPRPIINVAAAVRERIVADVHRLCGLRVEGIDIEALPINRAKISRVR